MKRAKRRVQGEGSFPASSRVKTPQFLLACRIQRTDQLNESRVSKSNCSYDIPSIFLNAAFYEILEFKRPSTILHVEVNSANDG